MRIESFLGNLLPEPATLELDNVSWKTASGKTILEPVSFALPAGSVMAVVGPNGAGKSTLLRLLYRFYRPSTGRILIDNVDIWSMTSRAVARRIAAVLQESQIDSSLTVAEVVALGRSPHRGMFEFDRSGDIEFVEAAISCLDLDPLAKCRLATLSGGERQRVMLARALAQQPQLLVLDEPTNHLDIHHRLALLELIGQLGITVICTLHDLNTAAEFANLALLLHHGKVLGCAEPLQLLTPERIAEAFAVKSRVELLSPSQRSRLTFHL